jgi:hypothetical protein
MSCLVAAQTRPVAPSKEGSAKASGAPPSREQPAPSALGEAVLITVSVQPGFAGAQELKLLCVTNAYRGESSAQGQQTSFQLGISGTVEKVAQGKFLITYDLEVRYGDNTGTSSFSAAGSGLLANGKPTTLVVVGSKSVVMTATREEPSQLKK